MVQFSTVIGAYLFAMGIGSFLSRFIGRGLVARFISIELLVGLVGGFSSSALFLAFAYTQSFRLVLYLVAWHGDDPVGQALLRWAGTSREPMA